MTADPAVSVVIPCFNASKTIGLQLEALRQQIDAPQFEVVLVDNASQDDLPSAVKGFHPSPDYLTRIVEANDFKGSSYARNVGISACRAEIILFCDADDVVSRTWVRNGFLSTQHSDLWSGESILLPEGSFALGAQSVLDSFDGHPPDWEPPADKQDVPFPILMGGNFGATRRTLLELRGFDQAFAHFGDDNELAFRARQAGHRIPVAETARLAYRGRSSPHARARTIFYAALARRQLLEAHRATSLSTLRPWALELAYCLVATVLNPVRKRKATALSLHFRWAAALGDSWGVFKYRHFGRPPKSLLGAGLARPSRPKES